MTKSCPACKSGPVQPGSWPCNICWLTEDQDKWEAKEDEEVVEDHD